MLRPYQTEAVDSAEQQLLNGSTATLIVAATGTGKTQMFVELMRRWHDNARGRCMVIAHRDELIQQAVLRISGNTGIFPAIEKAEETSHEAAWCKPPFVVASIQTLISGFAGDRRFKRFDPASFGLIVIDECHHSISSSYRQTIEHFRSNPACRFLGVTATPDRHDEQGLRQVFDSVAYQFGCLDAINAGWLVPVRQIPVTIEGLDFSQCRTTAGDLNGRDLEVVMNVERTMHGVARAAIQESGDRPTILFAPTVANAERLCEIINRPDYRPDSAVFICGKTDAADRHERISGFRRGQYQYLVNVQVTTEGFDAPATACIVMARPTKSRSLYEQMLGRGTRPLADIVERLESDEQRVAAIAASGKPDLLVIDFVGNSGRHKLVNAFDVLGGDWDDDIAELAMRQSVSTGQSVEVREALALAAKKQREARDAADANRRKHVAASVRYTKGQEIDPFDVLDVTENQYRVKAYERGRAATEPQRACLEKFGVTVADDLTMSKARQLITSLIERRKARLCTYKQALQMSKRGLPTNIPFELASRWMDAIARNGWRTPQNVVEEAKGFAANAVSGVR